MLTTIGFRLPKGSKKNWKVPKMSEKKCIFYVLAFEKFETVNLQLSWKDFAMDAFLEISSALKEVDNVLSVT